MRRRESFTHNRARDLRSRLSSEASRRDEEYYDTDYYDAEYDRTIDDMYAENYERQFQGGYHPRAEEGNYGRVKIPMSGLNADFGVYDEGDRSDYDLTDGLDVDMDIERIRRYKRIIPRHRHHYAPAAPRRRRR